MDALVFFYLHELSQTLPQGEGAFPSPRRRQSLDLERITQIAAGVARAGSGMGCPCWGGGVGEGEGRAEKYLAGGAVPRQV